MDARHVLIAGFLVLPFTAGCSSQPYPADRGDADAREPVPRLLTYPTDGSDGSMQALMHGTLRVNDRGCFSLNGDPLVAPEGTRVVDGGSALVIPGIGRRAVGEHIRSGGGSLTLDEFDFAAKMRRCLPRHGWHEFALVDPGGL